MLFSTREQRDARPRSLTVSGLKRWTRTRSSRGTSDLMLLKVA